MTTGLEVVRQHVNDLMDMQNQRGYQLNGFERRLIDELQALLDEVERLTKLTEWQPIEEAKKKDDKEILLLLEINTVRGIDRYPQQAHWFKGGKSAIDDTVFPPGWVTYLNADDMDGSGYFMVEYAEGKYTKAVGWMPMPLPSPPAALDEGGV